VRRDNDNNAEAGEDEVDAPNAAANAEGAVEGGANDDRRANFDGRVYDHRVELMGRLRQDVRRRNSAAQPQRHDG
jgi:hypothetical protein